MNDLPYDQATEANILGAILIDNNLLTKVEDIIRPEFFYVSIHKKIFEAITNVKKRGLVATVQTIKFYLQKEDLKDLEIYLDTLVGDAQIFLNIEGFIVHLQSLYTRRSIYNFAQDVAKIALENTASSFETVLEKAEAEFFSLSKLHTIARSGLLGKYALDVYNNMAKQLPDQLIGVTSGFKSLDNLTGGFQNSDLIILAARPSMGKTTLGMNIALSAAQSFLKNESDKCVLFYSLEMSAEQIALRVISLKSQIDSFKLKINKINDVEKNMILASVRGLDGLQYYVDDTPALSVQMLRSKIRKFAAERNVGIVVIDYLQLLYSSSSRFSNRVVEVSEITRTLKEIAKEINIPIIALSQLSRNVESRDKDKRRPKLSDLRESGSIEQDADMVLFIYRESYYLMQEQPEEGTDKHQEWQDKMDDEQKQAEIIIAKHRNGPIGHVKLKYDTAKMYFSDLL